MTGADGSTLRELDEEIQALVRAYSEAGERMTAAQVARLGLALADLTRALPAVSADALEYFVMVESVARAALVAIRMREPHTC